MVDFIFRVGLTDIVDFYKQDYYAESALLFFVIILAVLVFVLTSRSEMPNFAFLQHKKLFFSVILVLMMYLIVDLYINKVVELNNINNECVRKCMPLAKKVFYAERNYCALGQVCTRMPDLFFLKFCEQKCQSFEQNLINH